MEKFIIANEKCQYLSLDAESNVVFVDDINQAALHDENVELEEGMKLIKVQVIMTVVPVVEDLEIVEHTTSRDKILRGVIRKDINMAQAKAIDPYTFPKDGGYFIREKYLNK